MNLYNHVAPLLGFSAAVNTDQTGPAQAIISDNDDADFKVFLDGTQDGGATSPTVTVLIDTSHDGVKWVALTSIQLTADGTLSDFKALAGVGPIVRGRTLLGGATKPNHTASVKLASTHPFRLKTL